jgi:hypothetical protein
MGLVNSPSFPTAGATPEPIEVKKPKGKASVAPVELPEECCTLGCDNCTFAEEVTND